LKARAGIEKAFRNQVEGKGYSFVELLTNCPTNWGVSAKQSLDWITEKTIPYFPLGEFRNN
jgi:2-oxoglutarate ferredoxin oxidoreductase subunit beta